MTRTLAILLAWSAAASGQMVLFTAEPERPAGNLVQMGGVPMGDPLVLRMRLRNTGQAAAAVSALTVAGDGFSLESAPPLPQTLAAGSALEFAVRFAAAAPGAYSASLIAGGASTLLAASALPAHTVSVEENGAWRFLSAGMQVDFGAVERGTPLRRRFQVANRAGEALPPVQVAVGGEGFGLAGALSATFLTTGESAVFELYCSPPRAGRLDGWLDVGQRRFLLRASALDPPLPRPEIVVTLTESRSARQGRLEVRLAEASRTRAAGEVRLAFEPAEPRLASDPGIAFASGLRTAPFTIEEGDTRARFGGQPHLDFQTGSTAGNLVFTLEAGGFRETAGVAIPAAPPGVASARASRTASSVEVSITGLDNTRSTARLSFTFYGGNGAVLPPGPILVDCEPLFREYFETSALGGVFAVRAVFPVTGQTDRIGAVEAEIAGPAGSSRTGLLAF